MSKKCYSGIGGQAVIRGIMMRNKDEYSLAVRLEDGSIKVEKYKYEFFTKKNKFFDLVFIRGIVSMIDSFILGTKTLNKSVELLGDSIEEEQSKFEKWLVNKFGSNAENIIMGVVTVISFVAAIFIFVLLPAFIGSLFKNFFDSKFLISFIEGITRIVIFIIYLKLIRKMPDIMETFEYHGSEHKCINCIENGLDLTVENVLKSSKEHKRCGTSFIVYVMIISIFLFMFIPTYNIYQKMISRILLIPVVAGVSYEVLRIMGRYDNKIVDFISKPGMWMQGLTTAEPNAKQAEVAIKAVNEVFDWKKFKEENFS